MSAPDSTPAREDETPDRSSRRAFLGRAAAGAAAGGLVWAAPSILTIDAAAAASCGTGTHTLNWATVPTGAPGPSSVTAAGVITTISHTDPQNRAFTDSFHVLTGTFGNQSAWYEMQMSGASTGNLQTATFTFNKALNGLKFTFLDIDQSTTNGNRWRDVVSVVATGPGGSVAWTNSAMGSNITGTGTAADPFVASNGTNAPDNSTAGNVTLAFNAAVTKIVVTYAAARPGVGNGPWAEQRIGIGNLTWTSCT